MSILYLALCIYTGKYTLRFVLYKIDVSYMYFEMSLFDLSLEFPREMNAGMFSPGAFSTWNYG